MLSYQTWALSSLNANLSAISICLLLSLCVACILFVQRNEKYVSYLLINRNELYANDVRRMNNGVFNAMTDEEEQ
ncbi:hypothetical protein T01_11636 [Trichinella spiralis]|uniref:Uncharacterized protein n=1 Tax=Trichinella spiralis TaxID=6334 RepID=A0A0V1AI61_TRISP|nr:hypothetical protein T01_11636 [Trichinella spiralis]